MVGHHSSCIMQTQSQAVERKLLYKTKKNTREQQTKWRESHEVRLRGAQVWVQEPVRSSSQSMQRRMWSGESAAQTSIICR